MNHLEWLYTVDNELKRINQESWKISRKKYKYRVVTYVQFNKVCFGEKIMPKYVDGK